MLSLPGARWRQLNGDRDDGRLWRDEKYQGQAAAFWTQLARALRGHPALVAYNPLNEPHPEREFRFEEPDEKFVVWRRRTTGTAADLNRFNRRVVAAIRRVDRDTPILLDYTTFRVNGGRYAYPDRMSAREPGRRWNAGALRDRISPVVRWSREKGIPPGRIVASECGADNPLWRISAAEAGRLALSVR